MGLTVSTEELVNALQVIGFLLVLLIGLFITEFVEETRRRKKSLDLRNCLCVGGVDRCPVYHEDLKALEKALDMSKCQHIQTIFTSLKDDP